MAVSIYLGIISIFRPPMPIYCAPLKHEMTKALGGPSRKLRQARESI